MPYIGTSPSNGVRRVHTYTATASQTTFSGASSEGVTLSYADTNYLDVYQNGILLGSADYTATSGTSVVLTQSASASDLVVIVVYDVFSVADTVSKTNGGTFDNGITIDESGATVLTVDRATSDGTIIDLQKDGTSVGKIGNSATDDFYIGASTASHSGLYFGTNIVYPMTANSLSDGATSLGHSSNRFNNLYLSGGAYIGGTGSANYLDDYEEGNWTAQIIGSITNPSSAVTLSSARYTKIGRLVFCQFQFSNVDTTGASGGVRVSGLPFTAGTSFATGNVMTYVRMSFSTSATNISPYVESTNIKFYTSSNNAGWAEITHNAGTGAYLACTVTYETT